MDLVFRATAIYFLLLFMFVVAGKRQLAQVDPFRLVLLLIISEATNQALINDNHSVTGAAVVISVLIGWEMIMSRVKLRFPKIDTATTGGPLILVDQGRALRDRMTKEDVSEEDILSSARMAHGLERMDQIKYAILEESGEISIVPAKDKAS